MPGDVPPQPECRPRRQWSPDARALDLVGDAQTLLIVRDLAAGPRSFGDLRRVLPGIADELLRSRLGRMVASGLLTRQPVDDYALTARSEELLPVLGALARWGHRWAWTAPREHETIDIGAILRIAPSLVSMTAACDATIELAVRDAGVTVCYTLTIAGGAASLAEQPATNPDARVSGSEQDWVAALGPRPARGGLCIEGDEGLALMLLDLVNPGAAGPLS